MIYAATFDSDDIHLIPRMEFISTPWRICRARAIRLPERRLHSLAAGLLLDYALKSEGYPPLHEVCLGPHGKPAAEGVHFNLTHCRGLAACVVSASPAGIDAEGPRHFSHRLRKRVFSCAELQDANASPDPDYYLTRIWTLKESLLKAKGTGISMPLHELSFSVDGSRVTGPPGFDYHLCSVGKYSIAVTILR